MKQKTLGQIIALKKIADPRGNLTVAEQHHDVPFGISRVYWTYDIPHRCQLKALNDPVDLRRILCPGNDIDRTTLCTVLFFDVAIQNTIPLRFLLENRKILLRYGEHGQFSP